MKSVYLLILQYDLPHTKVEHGADVEDKKEGADHREGEDRGPGGAGVSLGD